MKADDPQVSQRNKYVERKQENYNIIIFPDRTSNNT